MLMLVLMLVLVRMLVLVYTIMIIIVTTFIQPGFNLAVVYLQQRG